MPDEGIETLFGSFDENLRHLESALSVRLKTSGHDVVIEGANEDVAAAERVLEQLASLLREGYRLGRGDVKTAAQLLRDFMREVVQRQREDAEYEAWLRQKVETARASVRAGRGIAADVVAAEFAALREETRRGFDSAPG